jgi:hypothetical protein
MTEPHDIVRPIERLGLVVGGASDQGIDVKLDAATSVEDIAVGRYVTVEGEKKRFFGMITQVSLETTNPGVAINPPDITDTFVTRVVLGTGAYACIRVLPMLMVEGAVAGMQEVPHPVKTVPSHFSVVRFASQADVELVFGREGPKRYFIGNPLDMQTRVSLDLAEFVKRSNGVFGKTGTGKTFLTRLLLVGLLQTRAAVTLVFDMQSEYGWGSRSEKGDRPVHGLKQFASHLVQVFTIDEESDRRRKTRADYVVRIPFSDIEPEDIQILRESLNLTDQAVEAAFELAREFGDAHWIEKTLALTPDDAKEVTRRHNIHEGSYRSLRRGLQTLKRFPFLVTEAADNSVQRILETLAAGVNVILEFGRFEDITAYLLVANLLSRRIYTRYRERAEQEMGAGLPRGRPLVITIEEAHRFLNPELCDQTIFGTIAREMRKYNVSLLVIDQRPSGIDPEIMSQLGTKLTCLLDNEQDVDAVLAGVAGRNQLKSVLAQLENRQQALIFGHAVPMPVVVHTREYGPGSYEDMYRQPAKPEAGSGDDDLWEPSGKL